MEARIYKTKVEAIEAASDMIESHELTGVLRPSAIVQTITLNQIHDTMIVDEDRRAYMVIWPNNADLASYHQEANDKRMEIDGRYASLKQKIAEMEADNTWLLKAPTESADKVLVAEAPADSFEVAKSATGHFEVKPLPNTGWN